MDWRRGTKTVARWLLAVFFVGGGVNHFLNPDFYLAMMPAYLPAHQPLVDISGVFEVLGGVGLLVPQARRGAAWGLIALLVAVFPANLNMALNSSQFDVPAAALWLRLPFQALFIGWAFWVGELAAKGPNSAG